MNKKIKTLSEMKKSKENYLTWKHDDGSETEYITVEAHKQLLGEKESEVLEVFVRNFKKWLKGRNINVREKDLIRGYLTKLKNHDK